MKIGYPCINWTIGCKGDRTFRLKSYSEQRLVETVMNNLNCLFKMLKYNVANNLLFFRITSDLVPFASHPVCRFDWRAYFKDQFISLGTFIMSNNIRISMHPGQFTILNSGNGEILARSIKELQYHADVLDAIGLGVSAKIQIHVGGVYGNKEKSIHGFIEQYRNLDETIKRRLVIENDDRSYTVDDCMRIYEEIGVPILFDAFHHELNHFGSADSGGIVDIMNTWQVHDGIPMVDYSYHNSGGPKIGHSRSINISHFGRFLVETQPYDFDIMLEIKDKETSALKAVEVARKDKRFFHG